MPEVDASGGPAVSGTAPPMEPYLAAAVQMSSGPDRSVNLARASGLVREAAERGARLILLPAVFAWRCPRQEERGHAQMLPSATYAFLSVLTCNPRVHLF